MNNRTKLYKYAEIVINAKLDSKAKALLWFYAFVYNWELGKPSYWSQRRICASVGMSSSTYQIKRQYLVDLGWIKVKHLGFETPCKVSVLVGIDDPQYESKSWAKWHPSNIEKSSENPLDDTGKEDISIESQFANLGVFESIESKYIDNKPKTDQERFDKLIDWFG